MFPEIDKPAEVSADAKEPVKEVDPLQDFLGGYKDVSLQDSTVQQPASAGNTVAPNVTQQPSIEYYRTGKKAGQPRPPKKNAVTVNKATEQTTLSGEILTGALFITMVDLILPMIISGINNRFSKDKIKASDLYLSQKQKNELAPIADRVVKQFDFNGNPNILLLFSMVGIYGANFAMLKLTKSNNEKNIQNTDKK
jgi:hypothetical protein